MNLRGVSFPERNDDVTTLTTTEVSHRLDEVLDNLAESHEVVQIADQRHSGVLVSADDWRAIQETLYLTGISGVKESIVEGMRTPLEECTKELDW
jgi:antitoxin YefM